MIKNLKKKKHSNLRFKIFYFCIKIILLWVISKTELKS